ncbi:hypothetical protein TSUD_205960 [Trifolium subterraneum]|uniref:Uncharacterized protein n=1 Tax=Trifolium subterraneum TaxID=3900 RepID=A0A2Z6NDQ4_TRISU|nr:hypothetical protein TSUD_205960 [Trifolium subterraneum]
MDSDTLLKTESEELKHKQVSVISQLPAPKPVSELDAAAIKVQKVYKSYITRKNLADCAVVVEQLWFKALDYVVLQRSYVAFFDDQNPDPADVDSWDRARRTRAPQMDPHERYGHNLHMYYDFWFESQSTQPFFYWLDEGDGKDINLEKCPRNILQQLTGRPSRTSTI